VSPYEEKISRLAPHIKSFIERRASERGLAIPEEDLNRLSNSLAALMVLGYEYGQGDAYAGFLLLKLPRKAVEHVNAALEKLGVPAPAKALLPAHWALHLCDIANCDEKLKKAVEEILEERKNP